MSDTQKRDKSLYERTLQDRKDEIAAAKLDRELEAYNFRTQQVEIAKRSPSITRLNRKSCAYRVAMKVLERFPLAEPVIVDGKKHGRTAVAEQEAMQELSASDIKREKDIRFGVNSVRNALREAYATLKNDPAKAESSTADAGA